MKTSFSVIILSIFAVFGCKPEAETTLRLEVRNELTQSITLYTYSNVSGSKDTLEIHLDPMDSYKGRLNERGASDDYPHILHRTFPEGDTTEIHFNDTILLKHFNRSWSEPNQNPDSTKIYFEDPRNLYNSENYEKSQTGENEFKGIYRITEKDLEYAIEVNE